MKLVDIRGILDAACDNLRSAGEHAIAMGNTLRTKSGQIATLNKTVAAHSASIVRITNEKKAVQSLLASKTNQYNGKVAELTAIDKAIADSEIERALSTYSNLDYT